MRQSLRRESDPVTFTDECTASPGTSQDSAVPAVRHGRWRASSVGGTGKPSAMVPVSGMRTPLERRAADIVTPLAAGRSNAVVQRTDPLGGASSDSQNVRFDRLMPAHGWIFSCLSSIPMNCSIRQARVSAFFAV
jgi:hypothetical protein